MASDDDYMNFLNKANQDPNEGVAKKQSSGKRAFKTTEAGGGDRVPEPLAKVVASEAVYVSDSDEPFEVVALDWKGGKGLPDEEEFAKLIEHWEPKEADVEIMDPVDWDKRGQYSQVVDAVRKAGKGNDVRVYRVGREGARVEYWVVTREGEGQEARLVGLKALAVES